VHYKWKVLGRIVRIENGSYNFAVNLNYIFSHMWDSEMYCHILRWAIHTHIHIEYNILGHKVSRNGWKLEDILRWEYSHMWQSFSSPSTIMWHCFAVNLLTAIYATYITYRDPAMCVHKCRALFSLSAVVCVWGISKWHWDCQRRHFYGYTKSLLCFARGKFDDFIKATRRNSTYR